MLTSYAQNFEDVMLWRALKHIERGFYIDIGAQDPVLDSVSLAFYEHGWRGVHVEPTPTYAQALRDARPGERVVQAAIGDKGELIPFFEISGTGISTGDADIARRHEAAGFVIKRIDVPCIRLSSLFDNCQGRDIHWMKIDVEGMELNVLRSWAPSTALPWVVVLESTLPLSQQLSHDSWEPIVLSLGYRFAYFDGLNRFYVSDRHLELLSAFTTPPNVFDEFTLAGTGSHAFCVRLNEALAGVRTKQGQLEEELRLTRQDDRLAQAQEEVRKQSELAAQARAQLHEEQVLNHQLIEVNRGQFEQASLALAEREKQWSHAIDTLSVALRRQESLTARREKELEVNSTGHLERESNLRDRIENLASEKGQLQSRLETANEAVTELRREMTEMLSGARAERVATQAELSAVRQQLVETEVASATLQAELAIVHRSWVWRLFHGRGPTAIPVDRRATVSHSLSTDALEQETRAPHVDDNTSTTEADMTTTYNPAPEPSVAYLLSLFDVEFVRAAYAIVLGRDADSGGLAHYVSKLRAGIAREDILAAMATSDEGRAKGLKVAGLKTLTGRTHTRARRFLRHAFGGKSEALLRQMRSLENRVAANGTEVNVRFARLEAALRRMETSPPAQRHMHVTDPSRVTTSNVAGYESIAASGKRIDAYTRLEQRLFDRLQSTVRN